MRFAGKHARRQQRRGGGITSRVTAALVSVATLASLTIAGTAVAATDASDGAAEAESSQAAQTQTTQPAASSTPTPIESATAKADSSESDSKASTKATSSDEQVKNIVPKKVAATTNQSAESGVATVASDEDLGAPTHRKYIKDNGDGTYWLSLDVTGASRASTEKKHQPADVVLVMDSSGSMAGQRWDTATAAATALAQKLLTSENAALPAAEQVQMSVVDFDTTARNMNLGSYGSRTYWTTDSSRVSASFGQMDASKNNGGGTNWEAALESANGLSSNRAGVAKYIVFVSDGTPSFRNNSMGTDCSLWSRSDEECGYYYSDKVYGTGQGDPGERNFTAAVNVANNRSGAVLYAVSTGSEANEQMSKFANTINPKGTFFDGTDEAKLTAAFNSIIEEINKNSTYQDVLIQDTLSGYAVATDSHGGQGALTEMSAQSADGDDVTNTDPAAKTMQVHYDQTSKKLELSFPQGTKLSPNVTYTVSVLIKPSDEAYQYFIERSGNYPNTGDNDTDAEGNETSSGKPGFFSNAENEANVLYKVVTDVNGEEQVGDQKSAAYNRPVIQVKVPKLTLVKGVDNTNAGGDSSEYAAKPEYWKLSALKNNGAYGIDNKTPDQVVAADGAVTKKAVGQTMLAPGTYTLSETADKSTRYEYFDGFTASDWTCADAKGNTVEVNKSTNGTQKVVLSGDAEVTCTVVNTAKPASLTWQKVDEHNQSKYLGGSEWTLQGPGTDGENVKVTDNGAASSDPKQLADMDTMSGNNGEGYLRVDGLKWGEYTLTETKAPANYQLDSTKHQVMLLPDSTNSSDASIVEDKGKITNNRITVSSLPLTGGSTGRAWLAAGLGFGVLAALAAAWLDARRRAM